MPNVDYSMLDKELLTVQRQAALGDYVIDLAWSPDGAKLAAVTVEGEVFLLDALGEGAAPKSIGRHDGGGNSVSWRGDGAEFATAGHDGLARVWDRDTGRELASVEAGSPWVAKVVYNPCRNVLATAAGKQLKLWSEQRAAIYDSSDHASTIADVAWNPDGSGVAVAAYHGVTVHVPGKQRQPRKYSWKGSSLVMAWSPDARYIATGEQDSTVHFWHVKSGEHDQMCGFPTKVLELSWDLTGRWLATGGGSSVCLWDCNGKGPAGRKPREYVAHSNKLTQASFQPDGELLVSADADGALAVWDPMRHDKVIGGRMLSSPASCLRWSTGGKFAIGQRDGRIAIFEVQSVARVEAKLAHSQA